MALPTLSLDDRTYQQLLEILKSHIPSEEWSDHNPSDPGMALLELLAWLGEMALYRMDLVPASHQEKFLKLIADPPVPVTVEVTLRLVPPRTTDFTLPAGLRLATDYAGGRRSVFESSERALLKRPATGPVQQAVLRLRAVRDLADVQLGISDGTPDQVFPLPEGPVLVDAGATDPAYNPNPRVKVGAVEWERKPFLLAEASRANPAPPPHFMVEEFENRIRFGNGEFGAIPAAGEAVRLIRCQVLEGPEALTAQGMVKHFLNPETVAGLLPGEQVVIAGNADAQGGENFLPASEQIRLGLERFRNPTRLITAQDFERVVREDFNAFQDLFNSAVGATPGTDLVRRAMALMNRKPPLATTGPSPGHITLLILPTYDETAFRAAGLAGKAAMAAPSPALQQRLLAYLEPRRLITTRLHVEGPELLAISAQVAVVVESNRNTLEMGTALKAALEDYLSLASGYAGEGWPLGRSVRRSQIFQVLEGMDGVDHVESLALSPADARGDVILGDRQLPAWDNLVILVRRA